jgi:NADH dehydrogenase
VKAYPYHFDQPALLIEHLQGADTLYNTYWIRFEYGAATFARAVANTRTLFECARRAGVRKIVHLSVTNPALDSPLPYYAGKAQQEEVLKKAGLPYAGLRPTLVFGEGDILVNNIAWLMRSFPVFPIFGSGDYRLQPVHVEDVARLAVECAQGEDSLILDAVGPETFSFEAFLRLMAAQIKPGLRLVPLPPGLGIALGRLIGLASGDVLLTRDELRGLMDEKLTSDQAPNGRLRFSAWLAANRELLGRRYASELGRHFRYRGS